MGDLSDDSSDDSNRADRYRRVRRENQRCSCCKDRNGMVLVRFRCDICKCKISESQSKFVKYEGRSQPVRAC